jgi:hypothetical protein
MRIIIGSVQENGTARYFDNGQQFQKQGDTRMPEN